MEIKKTNRADLDRRWGQRFLIGLVVAGGLFYAALSWTTREGDDLDNTEWLDDVVQDIRLLPQPARDEEMIPVAEKPKPPVVEKITTDEVAEAPREETPPAAVLSEAETDGEVEGAEVETALPPQPVEEDDNPEHFRILQELPEFPGGMSVFAQWLTTHLKYPPSAKRQKIQGKVVVSFIVNKDGSLSEAKVEKPAHPLLDREALRVIRMMPRWKPGQENGQPCRTLFAIPIVFQL